MATQKLKLKVLIDKKANRVLFGEASKDFVDFLFGLLTIPVGSLIKLLTKTNMVGCIGNLYDSVEKLNDSYLLNPNITKDLLLNPKSSASSPLFNVPLLPSNQSAMTPQRFYSCASGLHHGIYTNDPNLLCPCCYSGNYNKLSSQLTFVASSYSNTVSTSSVEPQIGYVKEGWNYMVMDDLSVMPISSTITSITQLGKFNVDINSLEERVFEFGMEEGLELLKTSLRSDWVLTDFFLGKRKIWT